MFHDFEEIVMIEPWFTKNKESVKFRFPKISAKMLPYAKSLTTASLPLGVAGMFILICIVTITAYITEWYCIWFGVFFAFTFHLLIHCVPGIIFRRYVPAIVTSVICLPFCCYITALFLRLIKIDFIRAVFYVVIGIVLLVVTRLVMQVVMQRFNKWLNVYQNKDD